MSSTRQDAWSQDEDILLAEVVLRQIRGGGTQLQAFEEVGKKLSRTGAACGFRWNSYVRKQYKKAIDVAKKQRKELKNRKKDPELTSLVVEEAAKDKQVSSHQQLSFNEIVESLKSVYEQAENANSAEKNSLSQYEGKIISLEKQTYYLAAENERLLKEIQTLEQDYKALVEIMEKARKMVVLKTDDREKNVRV
ncbi:MULTISPECIES: RsfA family transcriptional regulator [Cytobacillus]|uniref:RsfA family transcriptional regulator n=1 Tax=Cytobacillus TaxID=2675230 RepID=UPI001CD57EA7|nr:RsfA family transcriptional regulator [Cytobacillus kochii]MCA1028358.1 RsfA family transcriptional regulator [Cytobacillus kochii]MCM3321820.1 RsfA family transcriptional regulator [Cytobacillus kochii]MCM3343346.1 RsfA family transcriptional regulator [Cytobacillus kochii]MDM5207176.1 RsfA family transcriptional regulator [Cytobacillus kochii]